MTTTDQAAKLLNVTGSITRVGVAKKKVKLTKKAVTKQNKRKKSRKKNARKRKRR